MYKTSFPDPVYICQKHSWT